MREGRGGKAVERRGAKRVVEEGGVLIYIMERIRAQEMAIKVGEMGSGVLRLDPFRDWQGDQCW